jgi:predicted enzyme related to lactoylglutathione lyase
VRNGGKQVGDVVTISDVATFQFFLDTEGNEFAICTRAGK